MGKPPLTWWFLHVLLFAIGRTLWPCIRDSIFFWLFLATAYRMPAKKPTPIAETEPGVMESPKKSIPDAATGSLFNAPTMLRKFLVLNVREVNLLQTCKSCYLWLAHTMPLYKKYQLQRHLRKRLLPTRSYAIGEDWGWIRRQRSAKVSERIQLTNCESSFQCPSLQK